MGLLALGYGQGSYLGGGLRYGKTANKKRATCFATLPQNELNSDVTRFTTCEIKLCNLSCCKTGSNV